MYLWIFENTDSWLASDVLISQVLNDFHKPCIWSVWTCFWRAQSNRAMKIYIEVGVKAPTRWQKMINGIKLWLLFPRKSGGVVVPYLYIDFLMKNIKKYWIFNEKYWKISIFHQKFKKSCKKIPQKTYLDSFTPRADRPPPPALLRNLWFQFSFFFFIKIN